MNTPVHGAQDGSAGRRLAGDTRAVAAVERMLERTGGRVLWSRTCTLHVEYDGWRTTPNEPVIERAWRAPRELYQRSEYEGPSFLTVYALTSTETWTSRDGQLTVATTDHHSLVVERYPFGFYNSFYAFAIADLKDPAGVARAEPGGCHHGCGQPRAWLVGHRSDRGHRQVGRASPRYRQRGVRLRAHEELQQRGVAASHAMR